jgi:hypothetical protein
VSALPKQKRGRAIVRDSLEQLTTKTRAMAEGGDKEGHFYKPLPIRFRKDGFNYRQIMRDGSAAMYEQTWNGCSNPSISYEVIHIRKREGFQIGARLVEAAEVYPNSEAWGLDGFTLTDRDAAFAKLQELRIASGVVGP